MAIMEYRTEQLSNSYGVAEALNGFAADGWRLAAALPPRPPDRFRDTGMELTGPTLILGREKPEGG